jgi:hypothetical protein
VRLAADPISIDPVDTVLTGGGLLDIQQTLTAQARRPH